MISKQEIAKLTSASPKEQDAAIKERVGFLKSQFEARAKQYRGAGQSVSPKQVGAASAFESFLHPTMTRIDPQGGIGDIYSFNFDDEHDVYKLLIEKLAQNPDDVVASVGETVFDYVGGAELKGDIKDLHKARMSRLRDLDFEEEQKDRGKISLFRNSNAAWCVERSAIAHQCFKFLGYDSRLMVSNIVKNGESEMHAFNIVQTGEGAGVLFDATMPRKNADGTFDPMIMRAVSPQMWDSLKDLRVPQVTYNTPRTNDVTLDFSSPAVHVCSKGIGNPESGGEGM